MLAIAYDSERLISVCLHLGDALSEADVEALVETIHRQAAALKRRPSAYPATLIMVETDNAPDAKQRRRIGEAGRSIDRGAQVLVTQSALVRMAVTAIRWFSPANPGYHQTTCGTYDEARSWLVQHAPHPEAAYDALVRQVRERADRVG